MSKRGVTKDWRVTFHYPGALQLMDPDLSPREIWTDDGTSDERLWWLDTSKPIDAVQVCGTGDSAHAFAEEIVGRGGWAEVWRVPDISPAGRRNRKNWWLIRQYPANTPHPDHQAID